MFLMPWRFYVRDHTVAVLIACGELANTDPRTHVLESLEGSVAELLFREQLQGCMARKELQFCGCSQIVKDVQALLEIGFCSVQAAMLRFMS